MLKHFTLIGQTRSRRGKIVHDFVAETPINARTILIAKQKGRPQAA